MALMGCGELCVRVVLDERLSKERVDAVRRVAGARPALRLGGGLEAAALLWVVPELDGSALQLVTAEAERATCPVFVLSCQKPNPHVSLQVLASGAHDVFFGEHFDLLLEEVLDRAQRIAEIEGILESPLVSGHLPGSSPAWRATLRELIAAARFSDAPILLLGETGTGKELLARLAHTLDGRPGKGALMVVDCTTLTPDLAGSELFGHERGAFTGSTGTRRGAVAEAHQGTLFLDEVGELSLEVQAKLLRTLQEGTYKAVGSDQWRQARFRLICATHRDLEASAGDGRFRADLYYRIASRVVTIPPLRRRRGDVGVLARHFLREFGSPEGPDEVVSHLLESYEFPGNVRELRQLMQSAAQAQGGRRPVSLGCLPRGWLERLQLGSSRSRTPPRDDRSKITPADTRQRDEAPAMAWAGEAVDAESIVRAWLAEGLGLHEITQRVGDLAIKVALAAESNHLGRASRRLGVTERAIQLRKSRRLAARGEEGRARSNGTALGDEPQEVPPRDAGE